ILQGPRPDIQFHFSGYRLPTQKVKNLTDSYGEFDERTQQAVKDLNELVAKQDLRGVFHDITDAFSSGIRETIIGIERGEQTLGEGLENLFRNALLNVNAVILDKTILEPIKGSINAFWDGFVEEFVVTGDDSIKKAFKDLGKSFAQGLNDLLGRTAQPQQLAGPGLIGLPVPEAARAGQPEQLAGPGVPGFDTAAISKDIE